MATRAENDVQDAKREWFTAAELADLDLPGLASDKRGVLRRAKEERWNERCDMSGVALARPRKGRGGTAYEYHTTLLPEASRTELALRSRAANDDAGTSSIWTWYDAQKGTVKAEAEQRHAIIMEAEALQAEGRTKGVIAAELARRHDLSTATIYNYFKAIRGVPRSDWLPALAPRRTGGGAEADIDAEMWRIFLSDYLSLSEPTLALCYERTAEIAKDRGLALPSMKTMARRLEKEVHPGVVKRLRKGKKAFNRSLPAQRRSVSHLYAMECVNIDGHMLDVRVLHPDGTEMRPILLGIQDIRSSKVLAWRVCEVESAHYVRLVFGDLFANAGIPTHCVLDNGRGFASKWITGKTSFRFRNKVKPEDPVGLVVKMGIQVHWAMPYHGQAKPIERAWLDLTDRISRHAFCEGAYTGRNTTKKPENYGSRAIPWDEFAAHVDRQIAKHNARLGRRGRDYRGRSFDDVFAESYATAPISKIATPEQLRYALLAAEQKRLNSETGELMLFGNRYYSEECARHHGKKVTVRFDPGDLTKDVHLYDMDDAYLCSARSWGDVPFLDAESARKTRKWVAEQNRKAREGEKALELLSAREVAALEVGAPKFELPEAGATRIVRQRGSAALKLDPEAMPILPETPNRVINLFGRLPRDD